MTDFQLTILGWLVLAVVLSGITVHAFLRAEEHEEWD